MGVGRSYYRLRFLGLVVPLALALVAGIWQLVAADGRIELLSSVPLEVEVEARPLALQRDGRHWWGTVSRGTHSVRVRVQGGEWQTMVVEIKSGFDDVIVAAESSQCFVMLLRGFRLQVLQRVPALTPTTMAQGVAYGDDDLKAHPNAVNVLVDVDCETLALSDKDLVARLSGE